MPTARLPARLLRLILIALPLAISLAGCETLEKLNPFDEKKTPVAGDRKPVFASGVPGIEFNAPPPQPSNSNVPISSAINANENPDRAVAEPGSKSDAQSGQPAAKKPASKSVSKSATKSETKSEPKPASRSASKPASDDPWADQR